MPRIEGGDSVWPVPAVDAVAAVAGLGPHGERPAPAERIVLSADDTAAVKARAFKVAVVLHTTESDWAKQQLAGIGAMLRNHAAAITTVVDCGFSADRQAQALMQLAGEKLDAVISIPLGNTRAVTDAYRAISTAGKKVVLLDNAPVGLMPESDYVSVVSADNFGLGEIAAAQLSPHVPPGGKIGLVAFRLGFFATTQREISFRRWIERQRPDVVIRHVKFEQIEHIESLVGGFLDANIDTAGLFAVWDGPALRTIRAIESRSRSIPMTTVDLGRDIAIALAERRLIKGVAAQRPFDQGGTSASVLLSALAGNTVPSWIVLPGLPVTAANVVDAFQQVWHAPAPGELLAALAHKPDQPADERTTAPHL